MDIDLLTPEVFAGHRHLEQLAAVRARPGLTRHPEPDGPGFWVAARYDDVRTVLSDPATFSSRAGIRLGGSDEAARMVADRMMVVSDPPRHGRIRRVVGAPFTPAALLRWHDRIVAGVTELVDEVVEAGAGGPVGDGPDRAAGPPVRDAVGDLTQRLPNQVICAMMNLPRADWPLIGRLTTDGLDSPDPIDRLDANAEIFGYFADLIGRRRARPGDDLISALLAADGDLTDEELLINCSGVLTGANETVRYAAAGALLVFGDRPDLWTALRASPELLPTTVEEILRWTSPGLHALRTVTRPVTLSGSDLLPGERVTAWLCSANRDPAVFPDPDTFRPDRTPNRHLAFGWGPHVCVGSRVARLELTALLTALIRRVATIAPAGRPVWSTGNFIHGLTRLPVRLSPA
ncbi:cytochrome P450 [Streptomyces sp. BE147]|uniref:cytochrome P450 n=1 Tax=unclassified Streptomyces TaxID=2593676 RepID=UPI002E777658|nr:cytochrome P450 [Streptomyces sp. BE147]MEE1739707.1 cytochrome P450 [Streptomyces sp. BE147]